MVSFSQLPAVEKDTIFAAFKKIFEPSYFVTALSNFFVFFKFCGLLTVSGI